jgi:hypothetical protein
MHASNLKMCHLTCLAGCPEQLRVLPAGKAQLNQGPSRIRIGGLALASFESRAEFSTLALVCLADYAVINDIYTSCLTTIKIPG